MPFGNSLMRKMARNRLRKRTLRAPRLERKTGNRERRAESGAAHGAAPAVHMTRRSGFPRRRAIRGAACFWPIADNGISEALRLSSLMDLCRRVRTASINISHGALDGPRRKNSPQPARAGVISAVAKMKAAIRFPGPKYSRTTPGRTRQLFGVKRRTK